MLVANWLRSKAATHFRSMNAELIAILHAAMQQDEANKHPEDDRRV
ncbi:FitA-like ribbon-helix-helix domain-containing protein [Vogesella margarita]